MRQEGDVLSLRRYSQTPIGTDNFL